MAADLRVIHGGGQPEPDAEALALADSVCALIRAAAEAGEWFYVVIEAEDGPSVSFYGDALELSATVEELAREHKRGALGLGFEE